MRHINSLSIKDEIEIGAARRAVRRFAGEQGFDETELAELEIVVQELGTNAVRYATDGGVLHWTNTLPVLDESNTGVELFYWDKAPGIRDVSEALRDGASTGGGLGAGFGAIKRLTDEFDLYSTVHDGTQRLSFASQRRTAHGTAIVLRKFTKESKHARLVKINGAQANGRQANSAQANDADLPDLQFGVWSRPRPGEHANGDGFFIKHDGARTLCAVIDGLGHGTGARQATEAALEILREWQRETLDQVIQDVHARLRSTRGAVMGVAIVDRANRRFDYAGVGNIDVRVLGSSSQSIKPFPTNGTLGARLGKIRVWSYDWSNDAVLVMSSDGVSSSWLIDSYPNLLRRDAQLLAGILVRDYGRDTDDTTVLIMRTSAHNSY